MGTVCRSCISFTYVDTYRQYTYIIGKYNIYVYELQKQEDKPVSGEFCYCFEASTNVFYICRQRTYIVFILQCAPAYSQILFNFHKNRQNHSSFCLTFPLWVYVRSLSDQYLLRLALHSTRKQNKGLFIVCTYTFIQ